jgi:hypothetical protein
MTSILSSSNQRQLTRPLDGRVQLALVRRARARDAARQNLPALRHERSEQLDVFVIDVVDLVGAELAHFAPAEQRSLLPVLLVSAAAAAAFR